VPGDDVCEDEEPQRGKSRLVKLAPVREVAPRDYSGTPTAGKNVVRLLRIDSGSATIILDD
jgi:hypothetical protein